MSGTVALLIDFGSTFTKLRAVDLDRLTLLGSGQGPSTVTTDIVLGLEAAMADLEGEIGKLPEFDYRLASSSAAGGLAMVTVGLVRELTSEAARQAALGAGAKLVAGFAYRLTQQDTAEIAKLNPDILLLAGGTDGGNSKVILHNAKMLAQCPIACPVILAGNRAVADEVRENLMGGDKLVVVTENVMPELNELNIEPTRAAIRKVFIERIVHAKGIDRAAELLDEVLMPTPAAVLEGARLWSEGYGGRNGLGPLMVIDVGGATTDVYSVCSGAPSLPDVIVQGLPEPFVKRTVEGDLGVRYNAPAVVESAGLESFAAEAGLAPERVEVMVRMIAEQVERLPESDEEVALDGALARVAVRQAARRHAGSVDTVYTGTGPVTVQRGKDLQEVATIVGTGGPLLQSRAQRDILGAALFDAREPFSLRPRHPRMMVDQQYILYACGLLSAVAPEAALGLGMKYLQPVDGE